MNQNSQEKEYKPGYYGKKRPMAAAWADAHIKKWSKKQADRKQKLEKPLVSHSICFSRKIGVGALEIADLVSENIGYRVVDREILEHMVQDTHLSQKIIEFYDERYPGKMSELFSMLINEKTFIKSDYVRQLVKTVTALANTEPTIFVGRGTHLILPRDTVLSVRLICSKDYRVDRLASLLNINKSEAQRKLHILDMEQHEFFKTVYQKKEASNDEFDLVINRDHIKGAFQAAQIVVCAFEQKFGIKKTSA
ncbi:MAG: cytidylate kinase-like family protein [Proteobacteria bacterium]|nr:cytidylate kinase-like family protein [Pseudomonadota bacterium]MBU1586180.1 cytidylate kinase-like family protein [Pseudomonadota bacterium]MBU2453051.1 cytidylate kinase-like family protein [Pseudomonadota bacterium]MBU2631995.1 cytidylate kinase-like family protein [Pseudomonadota bacterium]